MEAEELINRFENDLKNSIATRARVGTVEDQIRDIGNENLSDFVGALNTIAFDGHLKNILQIINSIEPTLLTYTRPDAIILQQTLEEVTNSKNKLVERVQYFIDTTSLISINDGETIAELLQEEMDNLHSVSESYLM